MKLCFLILTAPYAPWKSLLEQCAKKTWLSSMGNDHAWFSYTGRAGSLIIDSTQNRILRSKFGPMLWRTGIRPLPYSYFENSNSIAVDVVDRWDTMSHKFFSSMALINESIEYDFIVKVNTTTYVNILSLEQELSRFQNETYWGGAISKEKSFTGGWATVLSQRMSIALLKEIRMMNDKDFPRKFDDESLGLILRRMGMKAEQIRYQNLSDLDFDPIPLSRDVPFFRVKTQKNRSTSEPKLFQALDNWMRDEQSWS